MNETKSYVWVFDPDSLSKGVDGPFSLDYHFSSTTLVQIDAKDLVDSRIWLVAKNRSGQYLFGVLYSTLIERYDEGLYAGDFRLEADPYRSVRFLPRQSSIDPWNVIGSFGLGITLCDPETEKEFLSLVHKNTLVGFRGPSEQVLRSVQLTQFIDADKAVPDQLRLTIRHLAYGDAVRSKSYPPALSAIGGFALEVLRNLRPEAYSDESVRAMGALDPLTATGELKAPQIVESEMGRLPPFVDVLLEELDIDRISPRTFVAKSSTTAGDWMEKTLKAEVSHERILKDVAQHLKDLGYVLKKSRSIDLYAEKGNNKYLFEVKSTTSDNLVSQGEHGIVQLLRYSIALNQPDVNYSLLLENQEGALSMEYVNTMVERVGFELLAYERTKDWPVRMFRFRDKKPLNL